MKAVIQNYRNGEIIIADVPPPALRPGGILVKNAVSLISAGTEKAMIEMAQKSLLGKAGERPDLVRQVMEKARKDGIIPTIEAVFRRLDTPVPLGYSSAGTVISVGEGVENFRIGDRVACAGAGYASHADVVFVPKNLAVSVPDCVSFESAAFTTAGSIALQGLRLAELQLGETVAIIGLGLMGLLTAKLAMAAGCQVIGMDTNAERCRLAETLGIRDVFSDAGEFISACNRLTGQHGADKVIITASTKSSKPVELAGDIARDKAIVVAVGAVGMEMPRKTYYGKELTFRVSRSYGPGRYDAEYEEKGIDYPIGYVRWTENRNMQAFVEQMARGAVDVDSLITHRFDIADALKSYDLITGKSDQPFTGILLVYPGQPDLSGRIEMTQKSGIPRRNIQRAESARVGVLGAGSFATSILLPSMKKIKNIEFVGVCASTGVSSQRAARKFSFRYATTNENEIFSDPDINTVVISTRHNLHARQVIAALKAGKHVFVEKPLCLNGEELNQIAEAYSTIHNPQSAMPVLMVGYNRRFAPMAVRMKEFLSGVNEPLMMHYRVNAGYIPLDHWVHDPRVGGGRIIGEVCHFVDFLTFLSGSLPIRVFARALPNNNRYRDDNLVVTLEFENGSVGTITYIANGDKAFPKERVEVFGGGAVAFLDNYRRLEMIKGGKRRVISSWLKQDKGHSSEWDAFADAVAGRGVPPIHIDEIFAVALTSFCIISALCDSASVRVLSKKMLGQDTGHRTKG